MANLDFGVAQSLAGSLTTIGHPWAETAVRATAMDLIKWCSGAIINGRPCTPEQQAQALIDHVRENWEEWPDKGGTKRLYELFQVLFPPKAAATPAPDTAQLAERGLLAAPCVHCEPEASFCEYGGARGHAAAIADQKYWEERGAQKRTGAPLIQLTAQEFQRRGAEFKREERERKARQVGNVEEQQRGAS